MDDDDDDEDGDETPDENEEMIDEEELDLVDDELHDALSVRARLPTVTRVMVHQETSAADAQLSSALRTVQTSPRAAQLSSRGERVRLVRFSMECFHRRNLCAGVQLCPGLETHTGQDYLCCCEQENLAHKLCGGEFYQE